MSIDTSIGEWLPEAVLAGSFLLVLVAAVAFRPAQKDTFPRSMAAGVGGHYGGGLA